jgi:hypothetical protein
VAVTDPCPCHLLLLLPALVNHAAGACGVAKHQLGSRAAACHAWVVTYPCHCRCLQIVIVSDPFLLLLLLLRVLG